MQITDIQGTFRLHNGVEMPYLGLGVFKAQETAQAVRWAIEAGYRHIDTASIYRNEADVGQGLRASEVAREDVFIVSKVWNSDQGYDSTFHAFEASLDRLQMDYLDLYLVHWPGKTKFVDTWRALEELYQAGKIRAIGVSNFLQHHLEELMTNSKIVPMVNQMEYHPRLVQQDLLDFCQKHHIQYEAWSPIMRAQVNDIPLLQTLAAQYGKSPIQITLRWELQKGVVVIPKSSRQDRILANADLFDFELSAEDVASIDALDMGMRTGPDPDQFF